MIKGLKKLSKLTLKAQDSAIQNPLEYFRPTPPQLSFLKDPSKMKLLRGGNQIGKSICGAVETLYRVLGNHPYIQTTPPPIEAWIICHSWEQSKIIQEKLYDLTPKASLCEDVEFVRGKGFRGTGAPVIRFRNNSIIRVKTTQQSRGGSTVALASGTVDWIWIDEPPPPPVWSELAARILRTKGSIGITMTPIGVPVDYLKKMVEEGRVTDHAAPLTVANTTPIGCKPMLTQDQIDTMSSSYLKFDRNVRIMGDWEGFAPDHVIFEYFTESMISTQAPPANLQFEFAIGIDHGTDAGSQFAVLVAVSNTTKEQKTPFIYVLDEYSSGADTAENHARGILGMLHRNKLEPMQISRWTGDRVHHGDRYGGKMSNKLLRSAFEHVLGYPRTRLPFTIRTAFKPRFSVYYGAQVINESMARKFFQINPNCKQTIKSLKNWALNKRGNMSDDEHKHAIDACRYAIMPMVDQAYRAPKVSKLAYR